MAWNLFESLGRTLQSPILCQHSLKNVKFKSILNLKNLNLNLNLNLNHSQKKYQYKVFSSLDLNLHHRRLHLHIHVYVLCSSSLFTSVYKYAVLNVHFIRMYPCHLYCRSHVSVAYTDTSFVFIGAFAVFHIICVQCWCFVFYVGYCFMFMLDTNKNLKRKSFTSYMFKFLLNILSTHRLINIYMY